MDYFTNYQINDHIWQIKDPMGVLTTLIVGNERALLIDTAYGIGDLKSYLQKFTILPLIVVNSHGHMDHSCGNYQFEKIYISKKDKNLCKVHNSTTRRMKNIKNALKNNLIDETYNIEKYLNQGTGNLVNLEENTCFNLGGLTIKAINMEGHTAGSLGFLIEEDKILVTSDAACPFVWLFLEESTTVTTYIKMLERIIKLDFNGILLGHGVGNLLDKSRLIEFLEIAKNIDLKESIKVTFNDFENYNSYCYTKYKLYDQNGAGIVFDPNKI